MVMSADDDRTSTATMNEDDARKGQEKKYNIPMR